VPKPNLNTEKLGALFLLGVLMFSPPLMGIFDAGALVTVFGVPLLYFYLFSSWAACIVLAAWIIIESRRRERQSSLFSEENKSKGG